MLIYYNCGVTVWSPESFYIREEQSFVLFTQLLSILFYIINANPNWYISLHTIYFVCVWVSLKWRQGKECLKV